MSPPFCSQRALRRSPNVERDNAGDVGPQMMESLLDIEEGVGGENKSTGMAIAIPSNGGTRGTGLTNSHSWICHYPRRELLSSKLVGTLIVVDIFNRSAVKCVLLGISVCRLVPFTNRYERVSFYSG
jgi:hypothetical protein